MKLFVSPTSFLKPENAQAKAMLEDFADEITYNDLGVPLKGDEILKRLDGANGYIAGLDYITADVVSRIPESLKVISRYGAGVDRVDIAACKERGIAVTNTPGANATAVCELALGLMLALARNIPALHYAVMGGGWPRVSGMELCGRTLGIVGMGAIGKKLAIRAKALEMNVVAYDPYFDESFAAVHGIKGVTLNELIREANVISLHLPLTEATKNIINAERIAAMRYGTILVNTARGGLLDEVAAAEAVRAGRLQVGLDAFEEEPPSASPLKGLEHVVFTPHTGAHTAEAVARMGMMSVENAIAVLTGKPCPYLII